MEHTKDVVMDHLPDLDLVTVATDEGDSITRRQQVTTRQLIIEALLKDKAAKRKTAQRQQMAQDIEPHLYDALKLAAPAKEDKAASLRAKIKQLEDEAAALEEEKRAAAIQKRLKHMSGVDQLDINKLAGYASQYKQGRDELYEREICDSDRPVDPDVFNEVLYQCVLARSKSVPRRPDKRKNVQQNRKMLNKWVSSIDPEILQELTGVYTEVTTNRASRGGSSQRDLTPKLLEALTRIEKEKQINPDQLQSLMGQLQTDKLASQNATERRNTWIAVAVAVIGIIGNITQGIIQATNGGTTPTNTTA